MKQKIISIALATCFVLAGCANGATDTATNSLSVESIGSASSVGLENADESASNNENSGDASFANTDDYTAQNMADYTDKIKSEITENVSNNTSLTDELEGVCSIFDKYQNMVQNSEDQAQMNELSVFEITVWQEEYSSLLERIKETDSSSIDDIVAESENWSKYVDTMAERMSVSYCEGTIYPVIFNYNKAMRYKIASFGLASALADLNGEVTFMLPDADACGYYGNYDADEYLVITEGMESGSYEIIIQIDGKDSITGYAYADESEESSGETLSFFSNDGTISGTIDYFALGASFTVTESDGAIVDQDQTYEFTFKY